MYEDGHCKEDEDFPVLTHVGESNIHTCKCTQTYCGPGSVLSFE